MSNNNNSQLEEVTDKEATSKLDEWLCKSLDYGAQSLVEGFEDVVDGAAADLGLWMADRTGGNEHLQHAVYILTTFTILEFCQNVLHIGAGFTRIDPLLFTLHQLKKKMEAIESKLDTILDGPLQVARDYFFSGMTQMTNNNCNVAYDKFNEVCRQATTAFHNYKAKSASEKISVDKFKDVIESVKLVIFSNILLSSYDIDRRVFVPYVMMITSKKNAIGAELGKDNLGYLSINF